MGWLTDSEGNGIHDLSIVTGGSPEVSIVAFQCSGYRSVLFELNSLHSNDQPTDNLAPYSTIIYSSFEEVHKQLHPIRVSVIGDPNNLSPTLPKHDTASLSDISAYLANMLFELRSIFNCRRPMRIMHIHKGEFHARVPKCFVHLY